MLPGAVEASILEHARRDAPNECCGLLIGNGDAILEAVAARNAADDPARRYLVAPADHFLVLRDARRRGLEVIGAYHSHPRSAAVPSATDRAEGFGHFIFLIAGLGSHPPEITGWRWSEGNFTPIPLVRLV